MMGRKFDLLETPPRVLKANFKDFSPGEQVGPHWSLSHLFILVVRGDLTFRAGPRTHQMKAGDVYSVPYATPRVYTSGRRRPAGIITLHLAYHPWGKYTRPPAHRDFHRKGGDFTRETMEPPPFQEPFPGLCSVRSVNNDVLFTLASRITGLFNQGDTPDRQALSRALSVTFIEEFRARLSVRENREDTVPEAAFHAVLHWIEHNHEKKITSARLANRARMSYTALYKLFKRVTGQSPMDYVIGVRMNRAKQLLAASGLSIKEIANEVGIANPQYFSRLFRKRCGVTPRCFQKTGNARPN